MEILGYGEDGLTLWALQHKMQGILAKLDDSTDPAECNVFYRPSFGRGGGANFGEFDFIIVATKRLYLGESKWDNPPKVKNSTLRLKDNKQEFRHKIMGTYVEKWFAGNYTDWTQFAKKEKVIEVDRIRKPIPGKNTRLARNMLTVLEAARPRYSRFFKTVDILLYLHDGNNLKSEVPRKTYVGSKETGFRIVSVDYSCANLWGNFVRIKL